MGVIAQFPDMLDADFVFPLFSRHTPTSFAVPLAATSNFMRKAGGLKEESEAQEPTGLQIYLQGQ